MSGVYFWLMALLLIAIMMSFNHIPDDITQIVITCFNKSKMKNSETLKLNDKTDGWCNPALIIH